MRARNAWREVLDREPVEAALCGDDSNLYTRLPVLLAARRKIPLADFHHGAFDGRYLLKDLPCDVYLAKNEMERDYLARVCGLSAERIAIGAPASEHDPGKDRGRTTSAIFFSEPYEGPGMRAEEVYRELLPPLCRMARENGRSVIIKLHPFESHTQRSQFVRGLLGPEDAADFDPGRGSTVSGTHGAGMVRHNSRIDDRSRLPAQRHLLFPLWMAIAFGIQYQQQYARFGVGELLQNAQQIGEIPGRLQELQNQPDSICPFENG